MLSNFVVMLHVVGMWLACGWFVVSNVVGTVCSWYVVSKRGWYHYCKKLYVVTM